MFCTISVYRYCFILYNTMSTECIFSNVVCENKFLSHPTFLSWDHHEFSLYVRIIYECSGHTVVAKDFDRCHGIYQRKSCKQGLDGWLKWKMDLVIWNTNWYVNAYDKICESTWASKMYYQTYQIWFWWNCYNSIVIRNWKS